jgi:hypothetical protein
VEDYTLRTARFGRSSANGLPTMQVRSTISGSGRSRSKALTKLESYAVLMIGSLGLDESIRQDVAAIKAWPFLPAHATVVGYAFEVETGRVKEVVGL